MSRYRYAEIECDFPGCDNSITERVFRDALVVGRRNGWALGKEDYCAEHRQFSGRARQADERREGGG